MNDPQEKNTQNPYHIYYDNYLDTNACTECTGLINHGIDSREQWDLSARYLTLYRRRKPMILQINRTDRYPGSEDTNEKTVCCMYDSRPFPFCGRLQQ